MYLYENISSCGSEENSEAYECLDNGDYDGTIKKALAAIKVSKSPWLECFYCTPFPPVSHIAITILGGQKVGGNAL